MNRSLFRFTAHLQLALAILLATGCTPTQPFFVNESPDLQHYLNAATTIEYPDVEVASLAETTQSLPPLTVGNHDYQFWDLTLEECVSMALQNARIFTTTSGTTELRQNVAAQFISGSPDQFGSIYDVAIQQTTTQSIPLTTDGNGNRLLPRGALRSNQVGGVEDALAEFDAVASGFVDVSTTDRPQNVGVLNTINPQQVRAKTATQQSAISKRLATGGVATLRQQLIYSRNNTPINVNARSVPSDYTAIMEMQIQHPLSRNRGTYINRIPVVLARLNEDVSIADFEIQIRNLVRDVEVAYWDLYLAYRTVATSIIGRNSAMATAQFAKLNLEAGTGTKQELAQSVQQYFTFRARLEAALAGSNLPGDDRLGVYGRERALRELIGLAPTDRRLIRPIEEPTLARVNFDWHESVAQMLYLMPELRRQKISIKQSEMEMALAKNQILPDVNLSFLYRWIGLGDNLGPSSGSDNRFPLPQSSALDELTRGDYQELSVRLEFSQAVGVRRAMTRIRNAQIRLKRNSIFLQESERLAVSLLSDAVSKSLTHYQLVQTNAQRWQAAEQEVEARLIEYKKGLSPVNVVLQSQERQAEAQVTYYRALTEYNKSLNYVDFLKGTLLVNNNITLREGPWNSKAYCDALERARERAAGHQIQYGVTRPEVVSRGPLMEGNTFEREMEDSIPMEFRQDPSVSELELHRQLESLDLDPYADGEIPEVRELPLNQYSTPREMLSPQTTKPQADGVTPAPTAGGNSSDLTPPAGDGDSVLSPSGDGGPVAPMSHQTIGSGIKQPGAVRQASGIQPGGAPIPVNRRPINPISD